LGSAPNFYFFLNMKTNANCATICVLLAPLIVIVVFAETSQNDYVLFQAVTALRDALIRDWSSLGSSQIESVRVYLMNFVVERLR